MHIVIASGSIWANESEAAKRLKRLGPPLIHSLIELFAAPHYSVNQLI
jgi:hypothetical protein